MSFSDLDARELEFKPFETFHTGRVLLVAGTPQDYNAMTIGWGMYGCFWNHPSVTVYARQSRYTKEFMDRYEHFSVCFFDDAYTKDMRLFGLVSGRDTDKVAQSSLTPITIDGVPAFEEASCVLLCSKVAHTTIDNAHIDAQFAIDKWYSGNEADNFHTAYIGFVDRALAKDE